MFNTRGETKRASWLGLTYPENSTNWSGTILQRLALICGLAVFEFYLRSSFMLSACVAQCQDQCETKNNNSKLLE